jgi:hypothetical protein
MGTYKLEKSTAWVVLYECFGEQVVQSMKPSSLSNSQVNDVSDLLDDVIKAYKSDHLISGVLGFHSWTPPGVLSTVKATANGAREVQRANSVILGDAASSRYITIAQLPFNRDDFAKWMKEPSQIRGLKLREFLIGFNAEPPKGFDTAAAQQVVGNAVSKGTSAFGMKLLGVPGS